MRKLFISAFLLCFFSTLSYSQTNADSNDIQFWSDTNIVFPLVKRKDDSDKVTLFLAGTFRGGDNLSRPVDERIGFGFDFTVNRYLSISPSYLFRAAQPSSNRSDYEHRIRFDATVGKRFKNFTIRDRNRIEYRIRNSRSDSVRYRNRLTFSVPVRKNKKEIFAPFIATEPYYDSRENRWFRNEFSVGIGKRFSKSFSADFFYLWQRNFGATLKNVNAIGVNLRFRVEREDD